MVDGPDTRKSTSRSTTGTPPATIDTDRRNIVVVAGEALRPQNDPTDGLASNQGDALLHAAFMGSTGALNQTAA